MDRSARPHVPAHDHAWGKGARSARGCEMTSGNFPRFSHLVFRVQALSASGGDEASASAGRRRRDASRTVDAGPTAHAHPNPNFPNPITKLGWNSRETPSCRVGKVFPFPSPPPPTHPLFRFKFFENHAWQVIEARVSSCQVLCATTFGVRTCRSDIYGHGKFFCKGIWSLFSLLLLNYVCMYVCMCVSVGQLKLRWHNFCIEC